MIKLQTIELPVWVETLILLKTGMSVQQIALFQKKTYSHVHKIVRTFVDKGWAERQGKNGREIKHNLTKKGYMIVDKLQELLVLISNDLDERLLGIETYEAEKKREQMMSYQRELDKKIIK